MPRSLPWLTAASVTSSKRAASTPARKDEKAPKRQFVDDESDDFLSNSTGTTASAKRRRNERDRLSSSSFESPQPTRRAAQRTPSSSPPPTAPSVEYMLPDDEKWMMVEDEFNSTAQIYTKHLHHEEYKKLRRLADLKSAKTVAAIARPTDSITALSRETELKKLAEKKRARMQKVAAKHPGHNETAGSDDDLEDGEMLIPDRHLAGLMQGSRSQRGLRRVLEDNNETRSNTRAAAGFSKQEHDSPKRPRAEQRLPDIGEFTKLRRMDARQSIKKEASVAPERIGRTSRPAPVEAEYDEDEDEDDLDAPVRKPQIKAPSSSTSRTASSLSRMPPPVEKPAPLRRSSTANSSQKTYPRPALKKESSSLAGSPPPKRLAFDDSSQMSLGSSMLTRRSPTPASRQEGKLVTSSTQPKSTSEFMFEDFPKARSRLVGRTRVGAGKERSSSQIDKTIKVEHVPLFSI